MTEQRRQEEKLSRLLHLHTEEIPLTPHELISRRHEGLSADGGGTAWSEDRSSLALKSCPFDDYLGLRLYHEDPLPRIQLTCDEANAGGGERLMFVDHEFPVHEKCSINVAADEDKRVECIPGVITSSNCRDFQKDLRRVKRIGHFIDKAKRTGGRWVWVRGSSMKHCSLFSESTKSVDPRKV